MAGTDTSRRAVLGGPRVILVEPQLGENIGAAARAMFNCGLTDLALVRPREPWPNDKARAMASGADAVLEAARLFDNLEAAVADLTRVYATTARPRDMTKRVLTPKQAAAEMRGAAGERVGLVFGPERAGLTNDQLALADAAITVPLNPAYASLNLGQAVLIVGYEWYQAADATPTEELRTAAGPAATKEEVGNFVCRLEGALDAGGFFRSEDMRPTMTRNLRNMFQRMGLTEQEVLTLQGVLSALVGTRGSGDA